MKKNTLNNLLIITLLCGILTSCNNKNENNDSKIEETNIEYLTFDDDKEIFLSAYLSPNRMEEKYFQWAKELGLTHLYIDYYNSETESKTHIMEQSLEFCDKLGLKTIPMSNFGSANYHSWQDYPLIDSINDHPSFDGFNILDEPKYEDFDMLAQEFIEYNKVFNDKTFYTNLLRPGNNKADFSKSKDKTYNQYISGFIDKVIMPIKNAGIIPTMSQTLYPMMNDDDGSNYHIMESHLTDLARFQQETDKIGAKKYHFVQTVSFGKNHHATNEAEIRFQIYSGLAFGYDGFQYFTYWTPNSQGGEFVDRDYAMIDRKLNRSEEYYGTKAVNEEITKFDNVILSFEHCGLILVDGKQSIKKCEAFEFYRNNINFETLEKTDNLSVVSASRDTLISVMKDKNNHDGYLVLNYTTPTEELKDNVILNLNKAKAVMLYVNGEEKRIVNNTENYQKGLLSLNLNEGEGVFVIPIY